ncbi:MAG TPA: radical SAM protein, partial [Pseudomonadales bacterium]|nr:radical SAM protein [Pseudomonadales bacterium]
MGVELRPFGVRCNIRCEYCYQNPQRDAGNIARAYDLELMKTSILKEGVSFILFGGEPLLMPIQDLEDLWSWGYERFGTNGIQTNGTLINEKHVELFRKYRVSVGISIDGPGSLNDIRWAGSLEATRKATAKIESTIAQLCKEGIVPCLIVTLHRGNATKDRLPEMAHWFEHLDSIGIHSIRLHILEVDHPLIRQKYELSIQENIDAFLFFAALEGKLRKLRFDVFRDIKNLLLGLDLKATCIWGACDPYSTHAVRGVEGNGQRSNCGRTNKEGIDFVKSDEPGYERYVALYQTPQDYGGCQACRFFLMCKGQCPGTAIDGDWRNRTEHCA